METLIAGLLGLSDIIFDFDDTDILLLLEKVSYFIDIIYIGTDRSDTDQVVDLVESIGKSQIQPLFLHFFADTVIAFEPSGFHLVKFLP